MIYLFTHENSFPTDNNESTVKEIRISGMIANEEMIHSRGKDEDVTSYWPRISRFFGKGKKCFFTFLQTSISFTHCY